MTSLPRAHAPAYLALGLYACALACLTGAALLAWSARADNEALRAQALAVTARSRSDGERVAVLNRWVYRNQGFAKNSNYFLWPRLGATPRQIFEGGGDCADKSRLLAVMLDELGIESSLAMQYPCPGCAPVHTVVYARTESGVTPVDPVYDITFPDGRGGWLSVDQLRRDESLMQKRLEELQRERGHGDKIVRYDAATHHYRYATTLNWDKNALLQFIAVGLEHAGIPPQTVFRPRLLEDPKQALAASMGTAVLPFFLLGRYTHRRRRMRIKR